MKQHAFQFGVSLFLVGVLTALLMSATSAYRKSYAMSVWQEVGQGSASGGGISENSGLSGWPEIDVAPNGTVYVAWTDNSSGNYEVYVKAWDGYGWTEVGNGSASGGGISNNQGDSLWATIVADSTNAPIVAWHDNSSGQNQIYVRRWNGTNWEELGQASARAGGISQTDGNSAFPSIQVLPSGVPIVAWDVETQGDSEIYVRQFNGVEWVEFGTGSASNGGISNNSGDSWRPSLAVSPYGVPYVAWHDHSFSYNSDIYVRKFDNGSWVELGPSSASGGGISHNAGKSSGAFIGIGSNSLPVVVWNDDTSGNFEILARAWNGSEWAEIGESSASSGGISANPGNSASPGLAVTETNDLFVGWYDDSGDHSNIYVRQWMEGAWQEIGGQSASNGGVSNTAGPSGVSGIAVSSDGTVYVAWGDETSGDYEIYVLKYEADQATPTATNTPAATQTATSTPYPQTSYYVMTTSQNDPQCDTGFGGYINLEEFGIFAVPNIVGNGVTWKAFTSGDPITFYDQNYDGLGFTDDGVIIFDLESHIGDGTGQIQFLPDQSKPNNLAAVRWQDLKIVYDEYNNRGVSLATAGTERVIVEFDGLESVTSGKQVGDFEVVIRRFNNDSPGEYEIVFAYDNVDVDDDSIATIGVEHSSGNQASTYLNKSEVAGQIQNGLVVCFDYYPKNNPTITPTPTTEPYPGPATATPTPFPTATPSATPTATPTTGAAEVQLPIILSAEGASGR